MPEYSPDICPACGGEDFDDGGEVCTIHGDIATPVGYSHVCTCGAWCEVIDESGWDWFKTCPCGKRAVKIFEDYAEAKHDYVCYECRAARKDAAAREDQKTPMRKDVI